MSTYVTSRGFVDDCEIILNAEAVVAASKVWVHKSARPEDKKGQGGYFRDGRSGNEEGGGQEGDATMHNNVRSWNDWPKQYNTTKHNQMSQCCTRTPT